MPDRGALLYLTALLHDVGKRFSAQEGKNYLATEWKRRYCPPGCAGQDCPLEHPGHPVRGALFLVLAGFPRDYGNIAGGVLRHHGGVVPCNEFLQEFAGLTGTAIGKGGIRLDDAFSSDLRDFLSRGDGLASSVSRIEVSGIADEIKIQLSAGAVKRFYSPFWVFLGSFQACPLKRDMQHVANTEDFKALLSNRDFLSKLLESKNFFSQEWTTFRCSLAKWMGMVPEAQLDLKSREQFFAVDVGLSTHTALTAAIAMCYFRNGRKPKELEREGEEVPSELLVACLAFGGAEKIIDVPSHGALRQLRGRAASVSLLVNGFIYRLLSELELPPECILLRWDNGCFLLLPNQYSKQKKTREVIAKIKEALDGEVSRLPGFAYPRAALSPVYLGLRVLNTNGKQERFEQLYLRRAMRQAWQLAACGYKERDDCELVYVGKPQGQLGLTGASRCRVCGAPLAVARELCPACQEMGSLGVAVNRGKFGGCGLHILPRKAELPPDAAYALENLRVYVAPGGWPWRPPVGPGSPQQELGKFPAQDRPKEQIGIALVRCGIVERLLSVLENQHLLPARLAECFRLADSFFEALHREEKGVWSLRWSPTEALLMGRAEATLELLGELPELCRKNLGFSPEEMDLKAALAICPLDAPWREAVDGLRGVLEGRAPDTGEYAFLADGTPLNPRLAVRLLAHARQVGADGKYALDVLQAALCRGLKPGGYDVAEASSALILLEARAQGSRRGAVAGARKALFGSGREGFWSSLAGSSPTPEELLGWLKKELRRGQAARALAALAVARRMLAG